MAAIGYALCLGRCCGLFDTAAVFSSNPGLDPSVAGNGKVKLSSEAEWRGRACGVGIGMILFLVAETASQWVFPPSLWVVFNGIHIDDVYEGECPDVQIDRTNHQQFRGVYSFQLLRLIGTGEDARETVVVSVTGERDYKPSEQAPFIVELTNRLGNSVCPLAPGNYYVHGSVRPLIPIINPAAAQADSNIFEVHDYPRPTEPLRRRGNG